MTKPICRRTVRLFFGIAALAIFVPGISAQSMFRRVNDFDGDLKADFAVTRDEGSFKIWHIWQSTGGYRRVHWGVAGDRNASGDYDGDGKIDIAIARETIQTTEYTYYILESQTGTLSIKTLRAFFFVFFSGPQDYDGDGKSDPSIVFSKGSEPLIYFSSLTGSPHSVFTNGQIVRIGDMTGDGRAEASYSSSGLPTRTLTMRNITTGTSQSVVFGLQEDEFVPADFDGDGRGDVAIFRPSTGDWWWLRSSDNVANVIHWGVTGDVTVPGDYDGDGKTDQAVYRPGSPNGIYYVNGSQTGFQAFAWGVLNDLAVKY